MFHCAPAMAPLRSRLGAQDHLEPLCLAQRRSDGLLDRRPSFEQEAIIQKIAAHAASTGCYVPDDFVACCLFDCLLRHVQTTHNSSDATRTSMPQYAT